MSILAFNVFNKDCIEAAIEAQEFTKKKLIIQFSVSTVKYFGFREINKILKFYGINNSKNLIVHLDHCNDIDFLQSAVENGWRSVMADFSNLSIRENISKIQYLRKFAPKGRVKIEAEIGAIAGEEDGHSSNHEGKALPRDAELICNETDIDMLAIGIGNAHGHYQPDAEVDFEHFKKIHKLIPDMPLVLHGASGLDIKEVKKLNFFNLQKVNYSTDFKDIFHSSYQRVFKSRDKYNMTTYQKEFLKDVFELLVFYIEELDQCT